MISYSRSLNIHTYREFGNSSRSTSCSSGPMVRHSPLVGIFSYKPCSQNTGRTHHTYHQCPDSGDLPNGTPAPSLNSGSSHSLFSHKAHVTLARNGTRKLCHPALEHLEPDGCCGSDITFWKKIVKSPGVYPKNSGLLTLFH